MPDFDYQKGVDYKSITSKAQVGALMECADLVYNGYLFQFNVINSDWWYFKFRHKSNGRTIVVQWRDNYYTLSEGKKILKKSEY